MTSASDLIKKHCEPCEGGVPPLEPDAVTDLMKALDDGWERTTDGKAIIRLFEFAGFSERSHSRMRWPGSRNRRASPGS